MNCKPGDLAIVVKSVAGNEGKIVRCLSLNIERSNGYIATKYNKLLPPEPIWNIEGTLITFTGSKVNYVMDSCIKPIRDQPGEDESLTWAKVPSHDHSSV